ncbi:MAG: tripartite tricarboxylate transporter substrate binding protein [Rubrivivax sp.]
MSAAALLMAMLGAGGWAQAQAPEAPWPTKPIRLVVPYAPGGGVDLTARVLSQRLSSVLGQQVVVDNRPGGATAIAASLVAKAEPDGHTLLLVAPAVLTVNPVLYSTLSYKAEELAPVALVGRIPLFVVTSPDSPAKTVGELFERAKTQNLNFGSAGNGSMTHLGAELIKFQLGLKLTHVPYKGTAALMPDVATGRVDLALADYGPIKPLVDAGKIKVLATTSAARSALMPNAPSMAEAGIRGIDVATWVGVAAPAATPERILKRLSAEVVRAAADPALQRELAAAGVETTPMDQAAFGQMVVEERARWKQVIQGAGITAD